MPKPETKLVAACLRLLQLRGIYAWRNNTGVARPQRKDGSRGFVRFGKKGSADILGVLPGGRFIAVECKVGRNSTTPDQDDFLGRVRAAGGLAVVVRDTVDELDEAIRSDTDA